MSDAGRLLTLGAGIQGACVALAAARAGHDVVLVDQASRCLQRASLRNEGKIHLGYVYANDGGFKTAELMAESAFRFAPLLEQWLPEPPHWPELCSNPFYYIVARDTLVDADQLHEHYSRVERRCRELMACDSGLHYIGRRPSRWWSTCDVPQQLHPDFASAAVLTPEVSVDLPRLQQMISAALERNPRIELRYRHRVEEVARTSWGFAATGRTMAGDPWRCDAEWVANCLWDGRLAIDAQLGLKPDRPWVHRLKHRVTGRTPSSLAGVPSMTIVLGPFGDIVTRPTDDSLYLSWYPTCMTGWCTDQSPPASWAAAAAGELPESEQESILRDTLEALERIVPGTSRVLNPVVDGGTIFCWGETDIDDASSALHERHDIGVLSLDGYFSVNTGKLTTAPYFASQLVEMIA